MLQPFAYTEFNIVVELVPEKSLDRIRNKLGTARNK